MNLTTDPPRKIWLQTRDEEGNPVEWQDSTFSADERINETDICYVRWGKTNILAIERDAAIARAERAEAEAADAANDLEIVAAKLTRAEAAYNEWHDKALRYLAGMREVMERNATLRAQLAALKAAHAWRPVTKRPDAEGDYLAWSPTLDMYIAVWYDGAFHSRYNSPPTHWQPLPPAPDADQEARP